MESPALLGLRQFIRRDLKKTERRRMNKTQRRNDNSRRDPRQASMFGAGHTVELQP